MNQIEFTFLLVFFSIVMTWFSGFIIYNMMNKQIVYLTDEIKDLNARIYILEHPEL